MIKLSTAHPHDDTPGVKVTFIAFGLTVFFRGRQKPFQADLSAEVAQETWQQWQRILEGEAPGLVGPTLGSGSSAVGFRWADVVSLEMTAHHNVEPS